MYVVKFLIFSEYFVFFLIQRNMTKNEIYGIIQTHRQNPNVI